MRGKVRSVAHRDHTRIFKNRRNYWPTQTVGFTDFPFSQLRRVNMCRYHFFQRVQWHAEVILFQKSMASFKFLLAPAGTRFVLSGPLKTVHCCKIKKGMTFRQEVGRSDSEGQSSLVESLCTPALPTKFTYIAFKIWKFRPSRSDYLARTLTRACRIFGGIFCEQGTLRSIIV